MAFVLTVFSLLLSSFIGAPAYAQSLPVTWSENEFYPLQGISNPYALNSSEFFQSRNAGQIHAQFYPVTVTGILPPYEPLRRALDDKTSVGLGEWLKKFFRDLSHIDSTDSFFGWLGLQQYPAADDVGVYQIALRDGIRPDHRIGLGFIERGGAQGFTFSCATCHSGNLFGKTVLGMSNRFPRANELFSRTKQALVVLPPDVFQFATGATNAEKALYAETKKNLRAVGAVKPIVMGLDTSLAQVSMSLNRRNTDAYATRNPQLEMFPRKNWLDSNPADSKPAVWWNVKYKNRWLSDGSLVSGNPIFTNFIWNELGRGTDLVELEKWLHENSETVKDLTTAVFSSEAPKWTDFFPEESLDLPRAQAGEKLFNQSCARCHGTYEKGWSSVNAASLPHKDLLATTKVSYFSQTPVVDVGTDPQRWMGIKHLLPLNNLAIQKNTKTVLKEQKGYVPPPLVGIWARWPYMHNNSVPSLCAVLTRASERPSIFHMGEAVNREADFDQDCVGYPVGSATPTSWKTADYTYDTRRKGMSNKGHDEGIFLNGGKEKFTPEEKRQIVEYLKTL